MFKYLVIVLILIFSALGWMYFNLGVPQIHSQAPLPLKIPHLYGNQDRFIEKIQVAAFYFVPQNKTKQIDEDWKKVMEAGLTELQKFHFLQLQGLSDIIYKIYPEPIIGFENNLVYDTEITQHGNPSALINISEELEGRKFITRPDGAYPVTFIMYEGVGAAGAEGFFLVNREFLAGIHGSFGNSILAHEFYHTLGAPDAYEISDTIPVSADIMGFGRAKPLDKTYLSKETLENFGL